MIWDKYLVAIQYIFKNHIHIFSRKQGHTINGDGTTAQLLAMLVGKLEHELPEARRSYPNASTVDRWPFVFKEFERQNGYTTLLSEDFPIMSVFNYRLKGFGEPPTTKYLRPWWKAANGMFEKANIISKKCNHEFAYDYLKQFLKEYADEKKFAFVVSNLAHNFPRRAVLSDEDVYNLYQEMNKTGQLDRSLVLVFGDHGDRASDFRRTMQGKLEERLPFMALTLPKWFSKKHKNMFKNLQQNSKVLTTHYDIYSTLRHVLKKLDAKEPPKHKYGRSLFTDIASLDRTCNKAGIDSHWCPCLSYKKLKTTDPLVKKVTLKIVKYMNGLLAFDTKPRTSCSRLKLAHIRRAAEQLVNKDVAEFSETKRNKECDECGIVRKKGFKFLKKVFEIVLTVSPSQGEFEVTAEYNLRTKKITTGSISRINLYGKQPECIAREYPYLRKYCYCKN